MKEDSKWIWSGSVFEKNEYVDFVFEPELNEMDADAQLHISVDSEYVLWINGEFVNCGQYDDYPAEKVYDTLKVGTFLKKGKNIIAISAYYQGESSFQYAKGKRGLWFLLENGGECYGSTEQVKCRVSRGYQSGEIQKITPQLGFSFQYDARCNDEWVVCGSEGTDGWESASVQEIQTSLRKRPIKKLVFEEEPTSMVVAQGLFVREECKGSVASMMHRDYLSHRSFHELFDGVKTFPVNSKYIGDRGVYLLVDLGKEQCGFFTIRLRAKEGTCLDIGYGEHLKDLRVRTEVRNKHFANRYICKEGKQEFTYYFKRIAGRYLQVHINDGEQLSIEYIGLKPVTYPLDQTRKPDCRDSLYQKIYDVSVDTLKLCMHEHYEDCPWREQALYAYDSRNQALCSYFAFGEYEFAKASLELLAQGRRTNGQLSICAPTDETLIIPFFTLMWLLEVKEYTEYSGDQYFIEQYWDVVEDILTSNVERMKNGLVYPPKGDEYWNFYEWSEGYIGGKDYIKELRKNSEFHDGIYNLIFYMVLKNCLWMAQLSGKADFILKYEPILQQIQKSFHEIFWDEEKKLYATYKADDKIFHYGQLTQALAVYTRICDEERCAYLYDALLNNKELVEITLSYSIFKYEALLGYESSCLKNVLDEIAEKWGSMLYNGATTFWETLKGCDDFEDAGSLCHGWSAIPIYVYSKYLEGYDPRRIVPEQTGEKEVS